MKHILSQVRPIIPILFMQLWTCYLRFSVNEKSSALFAETKPIQLPASFSPQSTDQSSCPQPLPSPFPSSPNSARIPFRNVSVCLTPSSASIFPSALVFQDVARLYCAVTGIWNARGTCSLIPCCWFSSRCTLRSSHYSPKRSNRKKKIEN